jgi:hypothetical protein
MQHYDGKGPVHVVDQDGGEVLASEIFRSDNRGGPALLQEVIFSVAVDKRNMAGLGVAQGGSALDQNIFIAEKPTLDQRRQLAQSSLHDADSFPSGPPFAPPEKLGW